MDSVFVVAIVGGLVGIVLIFWDELKDDFWGLG